MERQKLFSEHKTQVFLSKFLSGEIDELEPVYDLKRGYHYPIVEAIVGDPSKEEAFLNKLYEAGILKRRLYDKIIVCPKCGSKNISIHYCCSYCKSFNIKRSALMEHIKCGYLDVEENFQKEEKLVCPKCYEELKKVDEDYIKAGMWCACKECGKSFDIPVTNHFCRDCLKKFSFEDAIIKDVYVYSLTKVAREEANVSFLLTTPIIEALVESGFKVESPAFLQGKSGTKHSFDIAVYEGENTDKITIIDLATSGNTVSEQPVVTLFAKVYDASPDACFLIAIPKISENGKKMAELYNIRVIEAKTQKQAITLLKESLAGKAK